MSEGRSFREIVRGLIGVPFVDGGRDVRLGVDCWGLLMVASARMGREVPEFTVGAFDAESIDLAVRGNLARTERIAEPEPGCIVMVRLSPEMPDAITHFGIYVGEGKFLHTMQKTGSCLSSIHDPFWSRKIEGFCRFREGSPCR